MAAGQLTAEGDPPFTLVDAIFAPDSQPGDGFGESVGLSDDVLVVGASQYAGTGAVYVYERLVPGPGWGLIQRLDYPGVPVSSSPDFGQSVAVDGDSLIVGAPQDAYGRGLAFAYERDSTGTWNLVQTLSGAFDSDRFGFSVALEDDTLVAGSPKSCYGGFACPNGGFPETAIYARDGGDREWISALVLQGQSCVDHGYSISLRGERLVIGAPDSGAYHCQLGEGSTGGRTFVQGRDLGGPNAWGNVAVLAPLRSEVRFSGGLVTQSADVIAYSGGEWSSTGPFVSWPIVDIHTKDSGGMGNWGLEKEIVLLDPVSTASNLTALEVCGQSLLCGIVRPTGMGLQSEVFVYDRNRGGPNAWGFVGRLSSPSPNGGFGASIISEGRTVAIGSPDLGLLSAGDMGTVYIYEKRSAYHPIVIPVRDR